MIYLTTEERDAIPFGSQVRSLNRVGRDIERRQVKKTIFRRSEKGLSTTQGKEHEISLVLINLNSSSKGMEDTKQDHIRYVNDLNLWEKRGLNRMRLAKLKSSRNSLRCCQEGTVQIILLKVMCLPVSLTVLGIVRSPEDAIKCLNQSAECVKLHDNSHITAGSDYKIGWCPRTVHETIWYLGWSCRKLKSKVFEEGGRGGGGGT